MNIAVTIKNTHLHKSHGGMETQNKVLVEGLVSRGHNVTVFSPRKEIGEETFTENGVHYVFVPCVFKKFNFLFEKKKDSWNNRSYQYVKDKHTQNKFDVCLCQSSSGIGLIQKSFGELAPIISISHGSKMGEVKSRLKSLNSLKDYISLGIDIPHIMRAFFVTQREFIHGSSKIIAVSNAVVKQLVDETFAPRSKFVVIFNGIKPVSYSLKKEPSLEIQFLSLGRIIRAKGVFILLDALKTMQEEPWHFSIVGDGPDFEELKAKITEYRLDKRISLLGWLSHDDAMKKMFDADAFVLPSIRVEGFPMVLVEAMFAGLPIIASDIGGNCDAIEQDITGYLVEPGNIEELKDKLKLLINNSAIRGKMSKNAKIRAEQFFTVDTMLDKYEEVFMEVINE